MFLLDDINHRIKLLLESRGISTSQAAKITGFKKSKVNRFQKDLIPPTEFLFALVEYLGAAPNYLFLSQEPMLLDELQKTWPNTSLDLNG